MANNRNTYQQLTNVSINKKKLLEIASNEALDETDLRVLLCLFTELNGWSPTDPYAPGRPAVDPLNFSIIDINEIANTLDIKKKKVKRSIKNLFDLCIIEDGSSQTVSHGYRFTF